jgi:hypothetical protein
LCQQVPLRIDSGLGARFDCALSSSSSVKVVRHMRRNFSCAELWKTEGASPQASLRGAVPCSRVRTRRWRRRAIFRGLSGPFAGLDDEFYKKGMSRKKLRLGRKAKISSRDPAHFSVSHSHGLHRPVVLWLRFDSGTRARRAMFSTTGRRMPWSAVSS